MQSNNLGQYETVGWRSSRLQARPGPALIQASAPCKPYHLWYQRTNNFSIRYSDSCFGNARLCSRLEGHHAPVLAACFCEPHFNHLLVTAGEDRSFKARRIREEG